MKPSHHPPLYLLVAVVSFFAGSVFGTGESVSPARETYPSVTDLPVSLAQTGIAAQTRRLENSDTESTESIAGEAIEATDANDPAATQDNSGTDRTEYPSQSHPPTLRTHLGDVEIFPATNPWNQDISELPVRKESTTWIRAIGKNTGLHPDFGTVWNGAPNGIPYVVVPSDQPKVEVQFEYDDESDPGPYPIPRGVPIEGGPNAPFDSDRHIIMIDPQKKLLYELFQAIPDPIFGWRAGSGAIFDLSSDELRPDGWTSADAAGLPVFPGLVRYEEVEAGEIRHALRFTVERTQRAYIHPARHFASRHDTATLPPMGLRVRLRADYDISNFPRSAQVILTALKRYGMLLADNGKDWFITGAPDPRWDDSELATLKRIKGRDLECVDTGPLKR